MHFGSASVCLRKRCNTWIALAAIGLTSCGGGGSSNTSTPPPLTVGGSISGFTGSGLVLQNNNGADLVIASGARNFQFPGVMQKGTGYSVTVKSQPHSPLQNCSVTNGSGAVGGSAVSSVLVNCRTWTPRFAYVANRGAVNGTSIPQTYINSSISGFSISASAGQTGKLIPLTDSPFVGAGPSSGPIAVASDPQGRFVFVHNAGSQSVSAYAVDTNIGALTPVPGSPYSSLSSYTPKMLVDPTGMFLIVGVNDSSGNGNLSTQVFSIDQTDGSLSKSFLTMIGHSNPDGAMSITIDPSGTLLFVGSVALAALSQGPQLCMWGTLTVLTLDRSTGMVNEVAGSPYVTPNLPGSLAIDPVSHRVYAAHIQSSITTSAGCPANMTSTSTGIAGYSYDSGSGAMTAINGSPFDVPTSDSAFMAIDPTGTYAYVLSSSAIQRYAIDASSGVLNAVGSALSLGSNIYGSSILIDQSGSYVYVSAPSTQTGQAGQIYGFAVDFNSGALTPLPGSPFAAGVVPQSITIIGDFQ